MARLITNGAEFKSALEFPNVSGTPSFPTGRTTQGTTTGSAILVGAGPTVWWDFTGVSELYFAIATGWAGNSVLSGVRISLQDSSGNNILRLSWGPSTVISYQLGASGTTYTGTAVMPINSSTTWRLIEVHFKLATGTSGQLEARVDGVSDVSQTAINSNPDSRASVSRWLLGNVSGGTNVAFDDMILNDTSGANNNSWVGDKRLPLISPSSDSSVQWTRNTGSSNFSAVNEIPPNSDTSYVQDTTTGHIDEYGMTDLAALSSGDSITGVIGVAIAKRSNAGTAGNMRVSLNDGGSIDNGPDTAIPATAYGPVYGNFVAAAPSGGSWDLTKVNALKSRIEVR